MESLKHTHELANKGRAESLAASERHLTEQQTLEWDQHIRQQTLEMKEQQKAEKADLAGKQKEKLNAVKKSGDKNALKALMAQCKTEAQKADQDFMAHFTARKKTEDESQQNHFAMQKKRKNDEWAAKTAQIKSEQDTDLFDLEEKHSARNRETKEEVEKIRAALLKKQQDEQLALLVGQQDEEMKLNLQQQQSELALMVSQHRQHSDQLAALQAAVKKMHEEREKKDMAALQKAQEAVLARDTKTQQMEMEIAKKAHAERLDELKDHHKAAIMKLEATFKSDEEESSGRDSKDGKAEKKSKKIKDSKDKPSHDEPQRATHRRQASSSGMNSIFHPLLKDSYGAAARAPTGATLARGAKNTQRRQSSRTSQGEEKSTGTESSDKN